MKKISFVFIVILLLSGIFSGTVFCVEKQKSVKKPAPSKNLEIIAKIVAYTTEHAHFKKQKINTEISQSFFDEYFRTLDPGRNFFTGEDIHRFSSNRDQAAFRLASGDISLAFEIFACFRQRLDSYEKFVKKFLSGPVSLSGSKKYTPNRSKLPYAANRKELEKLWEKRIINDMILMKMMDMAEKEEQKKATLEKKKEKKDEKEKFPPVKKSTPEERIRKRVHQYVQYYTGLEAQDVAELYLTSFLQIYDPHSAYMSPRTQEDFDINMKLSLVGIGAVLTNEDGYTKIVKIIPGGPADKDGRLKAGDRITAVMQENGERTDLLDMPVTKVVNYIRGKKGTKVTLYVSSQGSVQKSIVLTRAEVKLKDSEAAGKIHEIKTPSGAQKRIAVITLPSFYIDFEAAYRGDRNFKSSTKDVLKLLADFANKGPVDGLIIDLRSNGGGSLMEAVTLTGLFIPEGPVVQVRDPKNTKVDFDRDGGIVAYAGPLAVLTNRLSASAAEIFAGAIQDYRRGLIIGDRRTHGKGTVQTVADLGKYTSFLGLDSPAGSLKLTNAKFYRINGESTQLRGVVPDIVLPSFSELMELGEDKLPHAMQWDKIASASYVPLRTGIPQSLPLLRMRSAQRVKNSEEFKKLKKDMDSYRRIKDKKEVILDLGQRWKEYQAEKKLMEEQEKLLKLSQDDPSGEKKKKTDIFLEESIAVLGDYINWIHKAKHP